MRSQGGSRDAAAAEIAGGQHGVVSRAQLLAAGMSRDGIRRRVAKGVLHRQFPGVYRFGHAAPNVEARYMAAVLACGDGAALGGPAAAWLYRIVKGRPPQPLVLTERNRRLNGIRTRRVRRLDPRDVTVYRGIPITTVPRTLVDVAADMTLDDFARAAHEAEILFRVKPAAVEAVLARRRRVPGAARVRQAIHGDHHTTLSRLEREFLKALKEAGLPLPQTNRPAGGRYVDCRWPERRLTVELDGYRFHHSRHAWEQDRAREREARARGDESRRYTWRDVAEDREPMLRDLEALLRSSAGR